MINQKVPGCTLDITPRDHPREQDIKAIARSLKTK